VGVLDALKPGAPAVFDDIPDNICCDWDVGDAHATEAAFKKAAHVARISLVNNRLVGNPMEPRAVVAEFDVRAATTRCGPPVSSRTSSSC
jgi:carbon-monoxide dehydrogenase large subunit